MSAKTKLSFGGKPIFYGSTTVSARGQVVIPIKARRDFKLKTGEELLVTGAHGRFLLLLQVSEMKGVMDELAERVKEFGHIVHKIRK